MAAATFFVRREWWWPPGDATFLMRNRHPFRYLLVLVGAAMWAGVACAMSAEVRPARLSDAPVPDYTLPDPLTCDDGTAVHDVATWTAKRRPELLAHFAHEVYGRTPAGRPPGESFELESVDHHALAGRATRKEITVWFDAERKSPPMHLLLYVPNDRASHPHPAFLGLNFSGNHTVNADPAITLSKAWIPEPATGVVDHHATDAARGTDASKWQIETVIARGYATATAYYGDLCPDRPDGLAAGVNAWLGRPGTEKRPADAWGAIGVWAWGLSRALDYLETDPDIDGGRVAVHGHSRLGKTALWAGAQDPRFAMVISNDSGCGGAALSKRVHGETVARINAVFPHWFCRNFRKYDGNEAALPIDQHELLALIAPRPLCVASAEDDDWADPRSEFLSVKAAEPVYALWGLAGPGAADVPPIHHPVGATLRYHIRAGKHDLTAYDWSCYLDAADRWLQPQP